MLFASFMIKLSWVFINIEVATILEWCFTEKYVSVCVRHKVHAVDPPVNSGAGRSRARGEGYSGAAGQLRAADGSDSVDEASFQSYDDTDDGDSPAPPFNPSHAPGFQLPGHYMTGSLTTAYSFFKLFFPDGMTNSIVYPKNSYAQEKLFSG